MAAAAAKGVAFLLLSLFFLPLTISEGEAVVTDNLSVLERQEAQLRRLESLVNSLSSSVAALESSHLACSSARSDRSLPSSPLDLETVTPVFTPPRATSGLLPAAAEGGGAGAGVAVTKHKTSWSERFQFAAAARLEASAADAVVLPYQDLDGLSKYFAIGDNRGRVYIFSSSGDVLIELPSLSDSPVTSMLSYLSSRGNESLLFTGHADGSITAHRLWETVANGDDWLSLSVGSSKPFVRGSRELDTPPVSVLELYQVGRVRYIIASDSSGRIRVFTENGTLYGTAIASSRPLAFMKQRLLFLTATGAGSLDLRSMVVRETECEGLNGSLAQAYTFSWSERSKAYGFTDGGDLIYVLLLGDVSNVKCRVRSVRKSEIEHPVAIQTIKGHLLLMSYDKVLMYNISSQYYGRVVAPRPLFSASILEIKSLFLSPDAVPREPVDTKLLIAADREKLVVLGLGDGYIGIYRSNFPVYKVESNSVVWSGPALLFLLFLIGIWQFYVKKKDSLGWVTEEPFNSSNPAPGSSLLSSGAATDRSYVDDGSRTGDVRELRGGALRVPSRYTGGTGIPPRYAGGTGMSYKPASADPSFRGSAEPKFRGQNIELAGFAKRREPLFSSSQVATDHDD